MDQKIKQINNLHQAIACLSQAMNEQVEQVVLAEAYDKMVDNSPGDISARYWLMESLDPLSRKELKSVVDGFLIQLLNEEQAKKLVKFLLVRFPNYYKEETQQLEQAPVPPTQEPAATPETPAEEKPQV